MFTIPAYAKTLKDINGNTIYPQTQASIVSLTGYTNTETGALSDTDDVVKALSKLENSINTMRYTAITEGTAAELTATVPDFVLTDGTTIRLKLHANMQSGATLNVSETGAKPILDTLGKRVKAVADSWLVLTYNGTTGNFISQGNGGGGTQRTYWQAYLTNTLNVRGW